MVLTERVIPSRSGGSPHVVREVDAKEGGSYLTCTCPVYTRRYTACWAMKLAQRETFPGAELPTRRVGSAVIRTPSVPKPKPGLRIPSSIKPGSVTWGLTSFPKSEWHVVEMMRTSLCGRIVDAPARVQNPKGEFPTGARVCPNCKAFITVQWGGTPVTLDEAASIAAEPSAPDWGDPPILPGENETFKIKIETVPVDRDPVSDREFTHDAEKATRYECVCPACLPIVAALLAGEPLPTEPVEAPTPSLDTMLPKCGVCGEGMTGPSTKKRAGRPIHTSCA